MTEGPVLGIVDGITDAGACLFADDRLLAAVNEERLTRVKLEGGFPARSVAEVLRIGGVAPRDVARIAIGGIATPSLPTRLFRGLQRRLSGTAGIIFDRPRSPLHILSDLVRYRVRVTTNRGTDSRLGRLEGRLARRVLAREAGLDAPVELVEHHRAHAACAFFASPFERALVLTADSLGDGLSLTVSRGEGRDLTRLFAADAFASFGTFYALVTRFLGFRPYHEEGKVLALSAEGDAARIPVPFPLRLEGERVVYDGEWGLRAWPWLERLRGHDRKDIAAWLQRGTEEGIAGIAARFVERTGEKDLCVAGGLFANVRLNLRLLETPGVDRLFVFPHMGDGGLAVGAALAHLAPEGFRLPPPFLGPGFSDAECAEALGDLPFTRPHDAAAEAARLLSEGAVVARFDGRMEFGPRALGNRSVLAEARDPSARTMLNRCLDRTEFMPFAPVILAEAAEGRVRDLARARECARHMTMAFRTRPALLAEAPGAVHVDGTARCQVATREEHRGLHTLLTAYAAITGRSTLINTSFNRHGEPIVCTPRDAVRTFRESGIDALLLGPFLAVVTRVANRHAAAGIAR
ncbi:MAG TPA: carbamoyltransferase C-terminal domain-containing protein [Planctomycetota bacterium]|nr:carbamoyltransferase C-terminal domain-containing protein [Planctomycetota bacterium]